MLKELTVADIQIGKRHRRDFTPSERVAIAKAIEQEVGNRQGQRTDKTLRGKLPEVYSRKTRH